MVQKLIEWIERTSDFRIVTWWGKCYEWFCPCDRYWFDFYLLKKWYFQVDNSQDANYFWIRVNLDEKKLIEYMEWDIYIIHFKDKQWLAENIKSTYWFSWIDWWLKDENIKKVEMFCKKYWINNYLNTN